MGYFTRSLVSPDLDRILRSQYVAAGSRRSAPEMVVKLISSATERDSARHMVYYIGRVRDADRQVNAERVTLYHADGQIAVDGAEPFAAARQAARAAFEALEIEADEDVAGGYVAPPLMHHLTASYPVIERTGDITAARSAAAAAISEAFEGLDYPVLWGMHNTPATVEDSWPLSSDERPHSHIHIHILVRTRPEEFGFNEIDTEQGSNRLTFDREDLASLRALFAAYGQMNGLDVEATRSIDRVSDMIAQEHALYNNEVPASAGDLARRKRSKGLLTDRAPDWNPDVIGILYESDEIPGNDPDAGKRPEQALQQVMQKDPALSAFQARFDAADLALLRWRLLRRELRRREDSTKLADWYLENRPEVFGALREDAAQAGQMLARSVVDTSPVYDDVYEGSVSRYEDPDEWPSLIDQAADRSSGDRSSQAPRRSITTALASLEALASFSERHWPKGQGNPLEKTADRIREQSKRLRDEIALIAVSVDGGDGGIAVSNDELTTSEHPPGAAIREAPPRAPVLYESFPKVPERAERQAPQPNRSGKSRSDDFDLDD